MRCEAYAGSAAIISRAYAWIRTDGWMCACTHVSRHVRGAFLHVRMYSPQSAQSFCVITPAGRQAEAEAEAEG